MFGKKSQPPIKSLLAHGSHIEGHITFADGLRVDGDITGDIRAREADSSLLVISESASVIGALHADHIIINGKVSGPVHARTLLELQPRANIQGDVYYKALEMHQGALIAGQLHPILAEVIEDKPTLKLAASNA